jgi:class 3 adenylate cyclase
LFIYGLYFYKTFQVKKRNAALEAMVKDRTSELELEKNKSDELLHNILPASLVKELKLNGNVRPRRFNSVSIMFTDFKAFTYTTSVLPPEELVHELNDIFKNFDSLIGKYGLEKLKTIGDSYMAACGIPNEMEDHAIRIVYAALDFQNMIKERNKTAPIKWEMRLGIHSGSVVAGVVGTKKFTYDIWGDTVNIASRMESSGEPGEINISGYTYMLVRDHFDCEYRGKVDTKGKGSIDMYFVKGVNRNQITKRENPTFKSFKSYKQII